MAKNDERKYTLADLQTIVAAGMDVMAARTLLDEGYDAVEVLGLAQMQAEQRKLAAAEAQTATAKAMQKAMRPENETHPGISVFSKPKGERDDPKTVLPHEFWYCGYPMHMFPETEHWRELELAAQVQPGEYTVIRKDTTPMQVSVRAERDANLKLTKVLVEFAVTREEKWLVPPKTVLLYQLVHSDNPRKRFLEAMNEHLQLMFGESVPA